MDRTLPIVDITIQEVCIPCLCWKMSMVCIKRGLYVDTVSTKGHVPYNV